MKNIFILGGSKLQFDLIFEAKKLYFKIYLFDGNDNCEGKKYADFFYHIDIKDKEAILKKAKEFKPLLVTTIASEIGNVTACYISEKLGLISNSYDVAVNTTNKKIMKNIALENDINSAKFQTIKSLEDLNNWNIFPCIIKPIDSSAGRGVTFVLDKTELEKALKKAFFYTNQLEIIVEEYIYGKQFSVETISSKGVHKIVAITEEHFSSLPETMTMHDLVPARISNEEKRQIEEFIVKILKGFKINYGACHIEIRKDKKGKIYLIEIASRMGGWRSELINIALGISYCQLLLFSLLEKKIEFNPSRNDISIVKMILSEENFKEYEFVRKNHEHMLISDVDIKNIKKSKHLADSNGFYYLHIENKNEVNNFIEEHK